MRKVGSFFNTATGKTANVYRDSEWQEYRVKFYRNGVYQKDADYHCDDRLDADQTAVYWVNREEN